MANDIVVKNTLGFQFPGNAAQPTLVDMGRFIKTLKCDRSMLDTAYKISDEKSVYIRFKCEDAMKFALDNNAFTLPFRYTDGREVMVRMSVASGNIRYVRIFDLPPEVTDIDLSSVLGKYGTIKRTVRERFPADIGIDIFSGVRGVYIDIQSEIPEMLHFRGRKGRIYFEGIRSRCFVCKSDAHLKKECPIFKTRQVEEAKQQQPEKENEQQMDVDEGTGEAGAPAPTATITTRKQHSKNKLTEVKRQLPIDDQPQQKNISTQPVEIKASVIINPDGEVPQKNATNDSDSGSDLEDIDFKTATPEAVAAWRKKSVRRSERLNKKIIERYGNL